MSPDTAAFCPVLAVAVQRQGCCAQQLACHRASKRLLLLDYDGTLVDQNAIDNKPDAEVLKMVQGLCADPNNFVFIISGRARSELSQWFDPSVGFLYIMSMEEMLLCKPCFVDHG